MRASEAVTRITTGHDAWRALLMWAMPKMPKGRTQIGLSTLEARGATWLHIAMLRSSVPPVHKPL